MRKRLDHRFFVLLGFLWVSSCGVNGPGTVDDPEFERIIYAHDSQANLYKIDLDTLKAESIGNTGVVFWDIAINSRGVIYGISEESDGFRLYVIGADDAQPTLIGATAGGAFTSLVFDADDVLWAAGRDNVLATINPSNGATQIQGTLSGLGAAGDLIVDFDGSLLLSTTSASLARIDADSLELEVLGALPNGSILGMVRENDGSISAISAANRVYSVNRDTFEATDRGALEADFPIGETYGAAIHLREIVEES